MPRRYKDQHWLERHRNGRVEAHALSCDMTLEAAVRAVHIERDQSRAQETARDEVILSDIGGPYSGAIRPFGADRGCLGLSWVASHHFVSTSGN